MNKALALLLFSVAYCMLTAHDIPILEYHHINSKKGRFSISAAEFRSHLEKLYNDGFVTAPLRDVLAKKEYLKKKKVIILRFDDAQFDQFNYTTDKNGALQINPTSAVGILLDFYKQHPAFGKNALFCLLPRGFEQPEYIKKKINFLLDHGMELCNHGSKHINLTNARPSDVDREFGKAIDYWNKILGPQSRKITMLATPYGAVPKRKDTRERLRKFVYKGVSYPQDAILYGGRLYNKVTPSPFSPQFDRYALASIEVTSKNFDKILTSLQHPSQRDH